MVKAAKLLVGIKLDNGVTLRKGSKGHIMKDYKDGWFHFESNDGACKVKKSEFKLVTKTKKN